MACLNNTRQIGIAILNYESANGHLPPAYTVDENGNRLHSWRTLILPYMEEQALYESIDLSKPWDDPANAKARESYVSPYICPSSPLDDFMTSYMAVVGDETCFPGATARRMDEITDRKDLTVMIVEVDESNAVHWMSPEDVDVSTFLSMRGSDGHNHSGLFHACCADASCHRIGAEFDEDRFTAALTVNGEEQVDHWEF